MSELNASVAAAEDLWDERQFSENALGALEDQARGGELRSYDAEFADDPLGLYSRTMEDFGVPENYQELLTEAQNQASPAVIASEPREPAPEAIQDAPASAAAEPAPKRRRVSKAIQDAPTTAAETKSLNPDLKKQLTDILSSAKPMENLFENLRPLCVGVMNWLFDHYKAKAIASAKNLAEKGGDSTAEEQDAHGGLVALLDLLSKVLLLLFLLALCFAHSSFAAGLSGSQGRPAEKTTNPRRKSDRGCPCCGVSDKPDALGCDSAPGRAP
eukprot:TRINITY_DN5753_c0_g1_i4.p1 TRINITY_DN5753_c0_g1~~TRINITY_DN5753_c0_g1_i4.p1  ORF type:complete len:272 (+),score=42.89 TRINITY_DN5753_c0_g1_i4:39-854(+)